MDIRMNPKSFQMLRETARKLPTAGSRSLNRLTRSVKTQASSEIRKGYNLKKSDVDRTFDMRFASPEKLHARILARVKRLGLVYFRPRQRSQKGVRVSARGPVKVAVRRGKALRLQRAFVVKSLAGNVFTRRRGQRTKSGKEKLRRLVGPAVADLFHSDHMQKHLDGFISREFPKILLQNIKHVLGRTGS